MPVSRLPAVAAGPSSNAEPSTTVSGAIPRVAESPSPAEMFNPLAPPLYGSGSDLVTYADRSNVTTGENNRRLLPQGIRLLTIHPIW